MVVYCTHDNGGRAFRVKLIGNHAEIDRINYDGETDSKSFSPVIAFKFVNKWIGVGVTEFSWGELKTPAQKRKAANFSKGNSCLFQVKDNTYIFAGDAVFSFRLPRAESIVYFESVVGNNDVPYPLIATQKQVYFLIYAEKGIPVVPIGLLAGSKDYYDTFYGHDDLNRKDDIDRKKKQLKVKVIASRDG